MSDDIPVTRELLVRAVERMNPLDIVGLIAKISAERQGFKRELERRADYAARVREQDIEIRRLRHELAGREEGR